MTVEKLLKKLNIKYRAISYYYVAFTHSTFANEKRGNNYESYERLEFMGDSLISWLVSRHIYSLYKLDEGKMSLLRASFVKKNALVKYTKQLNLANCLITGRGKEALLNNDGILADIFESFIAAIYLDLGYVHVEKILRKTIYRDIKRAWNKENKDHKTLLQEYLQSDSRKIKYSSFKKDNKFITQVSFEKIIYGTGTSEVKKSAEQEAAKAAFANLKGEREVN